MSMNTPLARNREQAMETADPARQGTLIPLQPQHPSRSTSLPADWSHRRPCGFENLDVATTVLSRGDGNF